METEVYERIQSLDLSSPIWDSFFLVSGLVLVGSKDVGGDYNQAPKHMAIPLGWDNYFGFVCTPAHSTFQNIQRERVFTVTYPRPTQVILANLASMPRDDMSAKPSLRAVPTFAAREVDGRFVSDGYVFLECELEQMIGPFGRNNLVVGQVVAAHVHEQALRSDHDHDEQLFAEAPLLAFLQPGRFARIERSHSFPFPTDFML